MADLNLDGYELDFGPDHMTLSVPYADPLAPVLRDLTALFEAMDEMGSWAAAGGPPWIERLIEKHGKAQLRQAYRIVQMCRLSAKWRVRPEAEH